MAVRGYRPVPEIQFDGFAYPGVRPDHQPPRQVPFPDRRHHVDAGDAAMPSFGGIGAADRHSDSIETYLVHTAGLTGRLPVHAERRLLAAAPIDRPRTTRSSSSSPSGRYWGKGPVDRDTPAEPIGRAVVRRSGNDITVVTYGGLVGVALDAAEMAAEDGVADLEVLDLRSLSPLDLDTVAESVRRTQRCVVMHEAARTLGLGAEVAARIQEELFWDLEAPVLRVTGFDTPYPPARLEGAWLPGDRSPARQRRRVDGLRPCRCLNPPTPPRCGTSWCPTWARGSTTRRWWTGASRSATWSRSTRRSASSRRPRPRSRFRRRSRGAWPNGPASPATRSMWAPTLARIEVREPVVPASSGQPAGGSDRQRSGRDRKWGRARRLRDVRRERPAVAPDRGSDADPTTSRHLADRSGRSVCATRRGPGESEAQDAAAGPGARGRPPGPRRPGPARPAPSPRTMCAPPPGSDHRCRGCAATPHVARHGSERRSGRGDRCRRGPGPHRRAPDRVAPVDPVGVGIGGGGGLFPAPRGQGRPRPTTRIGSARNRW